jgi:hypothetical protein
MTLLFLEQRLQDLTSHLESDRTLIKEVEDELRDETNPLNRSKYRRYVEQLQESMKRYRQEYEDLRVQLPQSESSQIITLGDQLDQMDHKLDLLLEGQSVVYQSLTEVQRGLLGHYSTIEQPLLRSVIEQLNQQQVFLTQAFLDAIATHQLSEPEVQEMWAVVEERLPELPASQAKVAEIVKDPKLDAKHKLKVTLPVVPLLVNYEGEFELGTGFNLKAAWERLIGKLRKPSKQEAESPLWEVFSELTQNMTPEEIAQLPTDGAEQHDHYIYGTPKRLV